MSLCAWFPLTGTLDNQGIDNVSFTTTNASFQNDGKLGKCLKLGYSSDFTVPSLVKSKQISIAYWLRVNTATSTQWLDPIHYYTNPEGGTGAGWVTRQELYSNCTTTGFWFDNGSIVSIPITVGQWAHFAITVDYEAGIAKVYKDGVLQGTSTSVTKTTQVTGNNFRIGENGLDLSENDVRIYNHILSPKEVEILAMGLVLHYPLSDKYIESTSNLIAIQYQSAGAVSGWGGHTGQRTVVDASNFPIPCNTCNKIAITYSGSSGGGLGQAIQTISCTPSSTYSYSCYIRTPDKLSPLNGNILYRYEYKSDGTQVTEAGCWVSANTQELGDNWYRVWGTFTVSSSTVSFRVHNFFYPNKTCDYYIGCWQLELKSHVTPYVFGSRSENVVYDVSGYNYHGTKVGSLTYSSDTPRYSTSTSFNGVDDCIQVPLNTFFPNAGSFTINLWFKKSELGSKGYETVFGGISGFEMDTRNNSSTTLSYYVTGNGRGLTVQSPLNFDTWYMLTMVCDGTKELYYLNGEYKKQIEKKGMPTGNYFIGAWNSATQQNFKGLISDFRIYATALSANQIKRLYNTPVSLSNNGTLLTQGEFVET